MSVLAALLPNVPSRIAGLLFAAALAFAGVLRLQLAGAQHHAAELAVQLRQADAAFTKFRADVTAQTAAARAADAAHAAQVERDRAKISEEKLDDYEASLRALRARYDALRLHAGTPAADPGGRGATPVPGLPDTAGGADDPACQDGLPSEDALIASEQALQLKALQDWVKAQEGLGK